MTNPLVSIVICTFNRAHLIGETLQSVFNQTYAPVEIVVVDDCSTDATCELMRSHGERIRYHRLTRNSGIAEARTAGCRLARGDFIAFQDDDDLFVPDRISALMHALQSYPDAAMAVGDLTTFGAEGQLAGRRWLPDRGQDEAVAQWVPDAREAVLWPTLPVSPLTTLFRRSDGDAIGWFDPMFKFASEDKDFFARLAKRGGIAYIPKVVARVRRSHESLTRNSIRTEYWSMQLFYRHMQILKDEGMLTSPLYSRLQWRIAIALQRIAAERIRGVDLPDYIPADFTTVWLERIPWSERFRYWKEVHGRLPIKRLLGRL